jgi:hypothetical protein
MSANRSTVVVVVIALLLIGIIVPWVLLGTGSSPPAHGPTVTQSGPT